MILETERLILRPLDADKDFEGWAEMMADAQTMLYIGGKPLNRAQAWRAMATMMGHWDIRGYGMFAVIEKTSRQFIGRIGPWYPEGWEDREVGWGLNRKYWGKGYASEAGRASIDYVFNVLKWEGVIHYIDPGNTGSMAVAERLGSKRLRMVTNVGGVFEGDCYVYGQENLHLKATV
ncbi:MAG: GNAT family N-acetyltransferase [Robiginitomaculum sp.]|nr:MAG: GNAT family N-acetyltransferase [Robiginitomaculum sp.]